MATITIDLTDPLADIGEYNHDTLFYSDWFVSNIIRAEFVRDSPSNLQYQHFGAWLRFPLPLESYDTVENAMIRLVTVAPSTDTPSSATWELQIRVKVHAVDNAVNPISKVEALTFWNSTAFLDFSVTRAGTEWVEWILDVKPLIDEILARGGWVKDNYIIFLWRTIHPTTTDSNPTTRQGTFYTSEYYGGDSPQLVITYTPGVPTGSGYDESVISDVSIGQSVSGTTNRYVIESILVIEHDFTFTVDHIKGVVHTLTIIQDPGFGEIILESIESVLPPFQTITVNRDRTKAIEHRLFIFQDIGKPPFIRTILSIIQDIGHFTDFNRSFETVLTVEQTIDQNLKQRTVIHPLHVIQTIELEALLQNPESLEQTIVVTQDIICGATRTRAIEHQLSIVQAMLGYGNTVAADGGSVSSGSTLNYRPNVGGSSSGSSGFPVPPTLVYGSITLAYPTTSPSTTIILPKPLFSNREELTITRIQRRTRGGVLNTFSDDNWIKTRVFRYKFEGLNEAKVEEMFLFISTTLGLKIRLTDYEGQVWDGFIIQPTGESGQFLRQCGRTTEFDFEVA